MEPTKRYLLLPLVLLSLTGPAKGQFLRFHLYLPAGVEVATQGYAERVRIDEESASRALSQEEAVKEGTSSRLWVQLRATENLHVQALLLDGEGVPVSEQLLLLNDGSDNFAEAAYLRPGTFVLRQNPRSPVQGTRRSYTAWLGIPLKERWYTVIHYP